MFKSIHNRAATVVLVGLVAAGSAGRVESAGFALFEQGAKATAMGGAFVATADDPTPDTNRGADVSAVARDNHGQAEADANRPDDAATAREASRPGNFAPVLRAPVR